MKPLSIKSLVTSVVLALAGVAAASLFLVVSTTQGTRWLLTSATRLGGVGFSAQKIEGSLIDHLLLTGVRITLPQQQLEIGSLELNWKPLLLLAGTIAIQKLLINDVRIQDDAPSDDKPPVLAWPRVSESDRLLDAKIALISLKNLSYRRLQEQPFLVTQIAGSLTWQESFLSMTDLKASSTSGQINGSFSAGFKQPSLSADLAVALTRPLAEMDSFSLQVRRSGSRGVEQIAGAVTVAGSAGTVKLLEIGGDLGMEKDTFNLRRLNLARPGQNGKVTADGSVAFKTPETVLSLQVKVEGIDLAPDLKLPTDLSGTLRFAGTLDSYSGDLSLANQAKGWQAASVSATYEGTREGMKLAPLNGRVLDGFLAGNLDMNWQDGFTVKGTINGRNLNPARIDPDWKGVANFTAAGKLAWAGEAPLTGSVSADLLESRLHGQALTGELEADFAGKNLLLKRLLLHGRGFDLQASGQLNQRLDMKAQINDLSRLVPGSAGTMQSEGWIRWHDSALTGAVTGSGKRLAYAGTRTADARLTARLDQGAGYPMNVKASLLDVTYDGYKLNSLTVAADGTLSNHTLNATLRSTGAEARLALAAGYVSGIWKGEIARLAGSDKNGPWNLAAPAAFTASAENFLLSPLHLRGGASEHLEISANLALNPLGGQVQANWDRVNLSRFKPWFPGDTMLEGRISGQAKGIMLPGQRFELDGNASVSGGTLHQERPDGELKLTFTAATASWGWREETVSGVVSLTMAEDGHLLANFNLPVPARFPVAVNRAAPLRASLVGQVKEKGIITTLFPGLVQESFGELGADLAVNGSWEAPQVAGKLHLAKGGAYLPTAGIHLQDVQLSARLENNLIRIDSFRALSGPGHIEGTALINLDGWKVTGYQGSITGENFQTVFFPELRILSTPDLRFEGTPEKLKLRGELALPELRIVGSQSHAPIAPSSDVIREGRVLPPATATPMELDVQVRVLLGEKVFVKVSGINAQLGGTVDLSMSGLDRITSKGEIKVLKGSYRTYGVNLEIVRGRLYFAGGPINRPTLDFLALRSIGDVRAGVTVSGTLQRPVTKLYSEPPMPDVDVLAYIVLGHPLGSSGAQASLVAQAAGVLLTSGQAAVLQEQIKNKLGLSTLEIQGGVGGTPSSMGYKPLQVTPPGAIPATQQPGITETVLTVGKYLTPEIYVSYGKSLFTGSNLFRLRYDIFRKWQIETQTGGGESGVDLYYKMEFK
jgi:autotransporter translocation and assembly factor TamB